MNKIPLISICVPSYKRPVEIKETLLSIVTQFTEQIKDKIEIVVSDDA
jgi:glycosyltransferase involved in cell wall biosynthesis